MSKKVYGIDLGTTYSAIATLDHNALPRVIENYNDGGDLLASAVYFPEGEEEPVVGGAAKGQISVNPNRVVQFVKREIGKSDAQVYVFDDIKYDPIMVSSLILKRMKEYVEEQEGGEVKDVVITCPAYFGTQERNATRQAGEIAGLNVLNIVNEPTAAALNYCSREFRESRKIMVYDLGGGTFDITLFDFSVDNSGKAGIEVIKTGGDDRLGGMDWDRRLYEYMCELCIYEFGLSAKTEEEIDMDLRQKLRNLAEETKKKLTNLPTQSLTVNHDRESARLQITREIFEEITQDLVERTLDFARRLLLDANVSVDEVDVVLLVGGSTKMPMIKNAVNNLFPGGRVRVEQPDLAVAKGAALAAAIEFNEKIIQLQKNAEEIKDKVEEIVSKGGSAGDLSTLANEFEFLEALGTFENISEGAVNLEEIVKTMEETSDRMMNVPQVFSGNNVVTDRLNRSCGPRVRGGDPDKFELIIDNLLFEGNPAPSEKTETYYTTRYNQEMVNIPVYENVSKERVLRPYTDEIYDDFDDKYATLEEFYEAYNWSFDIGLKMKWLGEIQLPLPPNTEAGYPIEVTLRYGTGGLYVRARNPGTNESIESNLEFENIKSRQEVQDAKARLATIQTRGQ